MLLLAAIFACSAAIFACSAANIDADSMIANEVVCSANGRYCAVVRQLEKLPDFTSARAGTLFGLDEPEPPADAPPRKSVIVALYEVPMRRLIAEVPIDDSYPAKVLVADSGRYLVVQTVRDCGYGFASDDRLLAIYRADRSLVGALRVDDVFNPYDVTRLGSVEVELRPESDRREVIVIKIPAAGTERRIDLATATLLDEIRDIYPRPRVSITETDAASAEYPLPQTDCPFHSPLLVHLESAEFLRRAISIVLPEFPIVAIEARIHGQVRAEVMVSGYGEVLCVRSSSVPFRLSEAAREAVKQWRFRPLFVNGRRNAYVGEVLFHFPE